DVLFHPALLDDLLATHHDAALLMAYRQPGQLPYSDEEMKVKVRSGRVVDLSKTMDPAEADGENLGIVKFGPASAPRLVAILDQLVAEGSLREWAPRAFREFARERPLHAVGTRGYPGIGIDFPENYRARMEKVWREIKSP